MAATAKAKSAIYMRASREIYAAAKSGEPDPNSNLALRAAIEKYRKKAHVLKDASTLNQDAIDALVSVGAPQQQAPVRDLKKGLQQRTLDMIRSHLEKMKGETCTCDTLAGVVGLSKVTVRRYLNYLAEIGEIDSSVDYETGGRPCIKYFIRPDAPEKKEEEETVSEAAEEK